MIGQGVDVVLNTVARALGIGSLLFVLWAGFSWVSHPQLPAHAEEQFPPAALMMMGVDDGDISSSQAAFDMVAFAITVLAMLLAAALAAWLGWRGASRPTLRDLTIALALGACAVGWFWFLRPWPAALAGAVPILDYLFALAWCVSAWAFQNSFSVYPEPISHDLVRRDHVEAFTARPARIRAGEGFWRFWAWLPAERYGAYGRTTAPELRGVARLLRSRELVWVVAYGVFVLILWQVFPKTLGPSAEALPFWLRALGSAGLAWTLLMVLDPLAGARLDAGLWVVGIMGNQTDGLAGFSMAVTRWLLGARGLGVAVIVAIVATAAWHAGGIWRTSAFYLVLIWSAFAATHGAKALYMNWRYGTAEQRRAIAWIFLGGTCAFMLWLAGQTLISLAAIFSGAHDDNWLMRAIGANFALGPALIALVFVLSLWASILSRGSFDPALALRKGAGVVALGLVLTALFVAVEGAASSLIVTHLGMPSVSGPVIAGTVVALGFKPLRERVENRVQQAMLRLLPAEAVADGERRVCAVLFCDLSGYTRLSETDEKEAMTLAALLHRHARASASAHGGRVVKTIGDAVLCVFDDARRAIAAAAELNRGYRDEAARRGFDALPLHSGLHVGEVVTARDGDVFGASVNLAARLQSLAGADELVASSSVAGAIAAAAISAEPLPARRFKNIAEPVDCLRMRLA